LQPRQWYSGCHFYTLDTNRKYRDNKKRYRKVKLWYRDLKKRGRDTKKSAPFGAKKGEYMAEDKTNENKKSTERRVKPANSVIHQTRA
jgi:hypothetical protein